MIRPMTGGADAPADTVTTGNDAETASDLALTELGRHLQRNHYRFITVTPVTHAHNLARRTDATDIRDIFGWSRSFDRSAAGDEVFRLAERAGVLERVQTPSPQRDQWRSRVRYASLDDLLFVHSAYPTEQEDAVFFGPDTYRFVRFIRSFLATAPRIERAVDIGCGSGAAAIVIGREYPSATVLATDINPQALRFCDINARIANVNNVSPTAGDLLTETTGRFDLVVANPPYMMDPGKRSYRHGGDDLGTELSWRIVEAALPRLNPGGTLLLYTGVPIVDGQDLFESKLSDRLAGGPYIREYEELDPDVFSEELLTPAYVRVERIAVTGLRVTRSESP